MGKFAASTERPKAKSVSALGGGLCPSTPFTTRGYVPGPRFVFLMHITTESGRHLATLIFFVPFPVPWPLPSPLPL